MTLFDYLAFYIPFIKNEKLDIIRKVAHSVNNRHRTLLGENWILGMSYSI